MISVPNDLTLDDYRSNYRRLGIFVETQIG